MALLLPFLFVFLLTSATNSVAATNDFTAFVHKTCSNNQTLQNQPLDTLFTSLISQSSTKNFFKTTINNITGLYQCGNDISHTKCKTCVQTLINTIQTSCYTARAQLVGCYMWYEVDVYHVDYPPAGLWYKKCWVRAGTKRTSYTGQCEGDLSVGQCVDCVTTAAKFAVADCDSYTGDVYLQKCYISYPDGGDDDDGNASSGSVALMVASVVFVLLLHPIIIF